MRRLFSHSLLLLRRWAGVAGRCGVGRDSPWAGWPVAVAVLGMGATPVMAAGRSSTVPLEILPTGHVAVRVKLNGKGPFRLVFDTGSPAGLITPWAANAIGLYHSPSFQGIAMLGIGTGVIKTVQVGKAVGHNVEIIVMEHPVLQMLSEVVGRVDGIVGFTFFANFRTTIDYRARRITFAPSRYHARPEMENVLSDLSGPSKPQSLAPSGLWGMVVRPAPGKGGAVIESILPGGPAQRAGLRDGDIITGISEWWITSVADCYEAASHIAAGEPARVSIVRHHHSRAFTLRPVRGL